MTFGVPGSRSAPSILHPHHILQLARARHFLIIHTVLIPDFSLRLEQQDCAVTQIEVDEVLRLCHAASAKASGLSDRRRIFTVRYKASEIAADDAMPSRTFLLVELQGELRISA
jgi:hypothetical protein